MLLKENYPGVWGWKKKGNSPFKCQNRKSAVYHLIEKLEFSLYFLIQLLCWAW